jgi:hypothetical protein
MGGEGFLFEIKKDLHSGMPVGSKVGLYPQTGEGFQMELPGYAGENKRMFKYVYCLFESMGVEQAHPRDIGSMGSSFGVVSLECRSIHLPCTLQ